MLRKTIGALGVAAFILLATPIAANAAPGDDPSGCGVGGDNYALPGTVSSDVAIVDATGTGTVTVTWDDGYFMPTAPVDIATSGPGAVGSEVVTSGTASSGTGSMWATVTVADDAAGSLTVMGVSDCATGGVTVEVTGDSDASAVVADSDELAATGSSIPVVLIIAGAGALAFGAILLVARARGRRRAQE